MAGESTRMMAQYRRGAQRRGRVLDAAAGLALVLAVALLSGCSEEAPTLCLTSLDCAEAQACVAGSCLSLTCETNLDCPVDAFCAVPDADPEVTHQGTCAPIHCRYHADCREAAGQPYCFAWRCQAERPPECETRADCGQGQICLDQFCTARSPGNLCDSDEECANPQICDPGRAPLEAAAFGRCAAPCTEHADCEDLPGRRGCDSDTQLCVAAECFSDAHCPAGERCGEEGTCQIETEDCDQIFCLEGSRPFTVELEDDLCGCVACRDDGDCDQSAGAICGDDGEDCFCSEQQRCLTCPVATDNAGDCPPERPFLLEGCCVACLNEADCHPEGLGSICQAGLCAICNCWEDCECPAGTECRAAGDGTGRCRQPLAELGEPCTAQEQCAPELACNYSTGECVERTSGAACGAGCTQPMRCAETAGGAFCYGCDPDDDNCPTGTTCEVLPAWEGTFEGGRCSP